MAKKLLLCFHDFSVWNFQKYYPVLMNLKKKLGGPFNILVIPDTEGASREQIQAFQDVLEKLQKEGFEFALHGYKHKAEFSQGRSYMGLVGMNLTGGEAEFAGLSEFESNRLLQLAMDSWEKLWKENIQPVAFVPPTWYSNKYLANQVGRKRILYEDRFFLVTIDGKKYFSPAISFAGIPSFLIRPILKISELILKSPIGIPRIAIHPVDFPCREKEILNLVDGQRVLTFYSQL